MEREGWRERERDGDGEIKRKRGMRRERGGKKRNGEKLMSVQTELERETGMKIDRARLRDGERGRQIEGEPERGRDMR